MAAGCGAAGHPRGGGLALVGPRQLSVALPRMNGRLVVRGGTRVTALAALRHRRAHGAITTCAVVLATGAAGIAVAVFAPSGGLGTHRPGRRGARRDREAACVVLAWPLSRRELAD